jgi:hypothetical protein
MPIQCQNGREMQKQLARGIEPAISQLGKGGINQSSCICVYAMSWPIFYLIGQTGKTLPDLTNRREYVLYLFYLKLLCYLHL